MSKSEIKDYIKCIPEKYRKFVTLHSYHSLANEFELGGIHLTKKHRKKGWKYKVLLWFMRIKNPKLRVSRSFHSLSKLQSVEETKGFDYLFLSPVLDSISKEGHSSSFSVERMKLTVDKSKSNIVALGGISASSVGKIKHVGFFGVAILGSLWTEKGDPYENYVSIRQALKKPVSMMCA